MPENTVPVPEAEGGNMGGILHAHAEKFLQTHSHIHKLTHHTHL
jgi:hypothetical protein